MSTILDNYKIELFQISPGSFRNAGALEAFEVKAHFAQKAIELIPDEASRYWHVAEQLNLKGFLATVKHQKGRSSLVFLRPPGHTLGPAETMQVYGINDDACRITLGTPREITLDPLNNITDFEVVSRLMLEQLRRSLDSRYELGHWEIADTLRTIDADIHRNSSLTKGVKAHRAAAFHFFKIRDSATFFLEMMPRSAIRHEETIDSILRRQAAKTSDITEIFPYVRLPWGGTGKFAAVLENRSAAEQINADQVLAGRSFIEFAAEFYPHLKLKHFDSPLAVVGTQRGPRLYSCEALYPSMRFELLELLDSQYFSKLISRLKLESARNRLNEAIEWARKLSPNLMISDDFRFEVDVAPFEMSALSQPLDTEILKSEDFDSPGGIFSRPSITFKKANGSGVAGEFTIYPGRTPGHQGTLNDLMTHPELKPLDAPDSVKVVAFIQDSLENKWKVFEEALLRGTGRLGYRGIEETFGINFSVKTHLVNDFLGSEFQGMVSRIHDREFDCAINVIPKLLEDPERNRRIYTEPKTEIMRKGIPVQVIANDERKTVSTDKSLEGRARNSNALFGTACNVLGKIGVILTALSRDFADSMLADSAIMGYDVARVFPPISDPMKLLQQKRTSVPLAAPLFIFDNQGARITHQKVYRPSKENLLFAEHGSEIFDSIGDVSNLIIHKDGPF